jgi:hypothetical protein
MWLSFGPLPTLAGAPQRAKTQLQKGSLGGKNLAIARGRRRTSRKLRFCKLVSLMRLSCIARQRGQSPQASCRPGEYTYTIVPGT